MIYAVSTGSEGSFVKIGFTKNRDTLKTRIQSLQTSCPVKLTLIGLIDGDKNLESRIHANISKYRWSGGTEWFKYHPDVHRELTARGLTSIQKPPLDLWEIPLSSTLPDRQNEVATALRSVIDSDIESITSQQLYDDHYAEFDVSIEGYEQHYDCRQMISDLHEPYFSDPSCLFLGNGCLYHIVMCDPDFDAMAVANQCMTDYFWRIDAVFQLVSGTWCASKQRLSLLHSPRDTPQVPMIWELETASFNATRLDYSVFTSPNSRITSHTDNPAHKPLAADHRQ